MLALYRSGRQADALASYRELQAKLHREVGLDPAPALQQLHHQILLADPELLTPAAVPGRRALTPLRRPVRHVPNRRKEPRCAALARTRGARDREDRAR